MPDAAHIPMKVRSMVGLIPLFAAETFEPEDSAVPHRISARACNGSSITIPTYPNHVEMSRKSGQGPRLLLTIANRKKLERIYRYVLDENEFLSPHGIRCAFENSMRRTLSFCSSMGSAHSVDYEPANPPSDLFGGNSNWRGPIWFPLNFLLIESLQRIHYYYGDEFKVECPGRFRPSKTLVGRPPAKFRAGSATSFSADDGKRRFTATTRFSRTIPTGAT